MKRALILSNARLAIIASIVMVLSAGSMPFRVEREGFS